MGNLNFYSPDIKWEEVRSEKKEVLLKEKDPTEMLKVITNSYQTICREQVPMKNSGYNKIFIKLRLKAMLHEK